MKYTDRFFSFPIRIYDGKTLRDIEEGEEGDWIVGVVRMPFEDMRYSCWYDGFSRDKGVEEVSEKGFDTTIVSNKMHGQFNCIWNRKRFEEELNTKMDRYEQAKLEEKIQAERKYGNGSLVHKETGAKYDVKGDRDYWGTSTDPK